MEEAKLKRNEMVENEMKLAIIIEVWPTTLETLFAN